jgi:hypothetical protein
LYCLSRCIVWLASKFVLHQSQWISVNLRVIVRVARVSHSRRSWSRMHAPYLVTHLALSLLGTPHVWSRLKFNSLLFPTPILLFSDWHRSSHLTISFMNYAGMVTPYMRTYFCNGCGGGNRVGYIRFGFEQIRLGLINFLKEIRLVLVNLYI